MLDKSGKIVSNLKRVTDLMNKNFVYIADKLLNERKDAFHNNHEFCFSSVCNDFVFKKFTNDFCRIIFCIKSSMVLGKIVQLSWL